MASRVQMDVTGDDVNYFVGRGFDRDHRDLNTFVKVVKRGLVEERFRITGRPYGWQWYRTIWSNPRNEIIRNHAGSSWQETPIACYINAEVAGWRNENGNATE